MAAGMFLMHLTLLGGVSAQPVTQAAEIGSSPKSSIRSGINVSEFTDVDALGFLSPREVTPWGRLVSHETERMLLAQGDTVYVALEEGHDAKPGDLFTVFDSSSELDHPLSGRDFGYVITYLGRIVLKSEVKPRLFKADIVESYRPMQTGNPVLPFQPLSPCIQLVSPKPEPSDPSRILRIPVVAAKDLTQVIGQYSVVYLDQGHKQGIYRGNLFQIVARGQPDQPPDATLPDQALGYVLVLEAGPDTSTGLVITATTEFYIGTMLKAIDLKRALSNLLAHYEMEADPAELENNPLQVLGRLKEKVGSRGDLPDAFLLLAKLPRCPIP